LSFIELKNEKYKQEISFFPSKQVDLLEVAARTQIIVDSVRHHDPVLGNGFKF
jgi:hypothetical protein